MVQARLLANCRNLRNKLGNCTGENGNCTSLDHSCGACKRERERERSEGGGIKLSRNTLPVRGESGDWFL